MTPAPACPGEEAAREHGRQWGSRRLGSAFLCAHRAPFPIPGWLGEGRLAWAFCGVCGEEGAHKPTFLPLHPGHSVELHVIAAPESFGKGIILNLQLGDLKEGESWFTEPRDTQAKAVLQKRSLQQPEKKRGGACKLRQCCPQDPSPESGQSFEEEKSLRSDCLGTEEKTWVRFAH